jgi:hypothetical protein
MKRFLFCCLLWSCGSTGGEHLVFSAYASGPANANGTSLEFTNGFDFHVVLTRARLHIGAVYLNQTFPSSGTQESSCISSGIYTGEVLGGVDVDALSPTPQAFGVTGNATTLVAKAGEIWLTGGDINAPEDPTVILDVAGVADKNGVSYPFAAQLTIGSNRRIATSDPAFPSANPICKQRIVAPIPIQIAPKTGGSLRIRIDPSFWFAAVDFSTLTATNGVYQFADSPQTSADVSLYDGIHARQGAYQFIWQQE